MEDKKIIHIAGISLIYELHPDGSEVKKAALVGFDTQGDCFDIEDYERACEAARAAEAIWTAVRD